VLVVCVLACACAGRAPAASLSFDGQVVRWRDLPAERTVVWAFGVDERRPRSLYVDVDPLIEMSPGCGRVNLTPDDPDPFWELQCPVTVKTRELLFRFSLGDRNDRVRSASEDLSPRFPRAVVYADAGNDQVDDVDLVYGGAGNDRVEFAERAFGGGGNDDMTGLRLFGDRGRDQLFGFVGGGQSATPRVYGGRGDDRLEGNGMLYGGPGDDTITSSGPIGPQMVVGGPGRDVVQLSGDEHGRDIVRLRGGGADLLRCVENSPDIDFTFGPQDMLYVDRSDRLVGDCGGARVLLTGRPSGFRP